ncbi:MAG: HAD superfamily hydrolase (TIGR01509 family) [Cellvibrionaceae bacterium]|jgi:HAD superfamily hydrolase (TIGR01509 family)
MVKCLIFDCDGTLVDSELLCNVGLAMKLAEKGIEADPTVLMHQYRGWKLAKIMHALEKLYEIQLEPDFEPTYRKIVSSLFETELKPMAGVEAMLKQIDLPMCVASSGPRHKIEQALWVTGLSRFFGRNIFSSYEVQSWKPEPGLFLHAAGQMGFAPDVCAVVEDSEVGIEAAVAAGMRPILYEPGGVSCDGVSCDEGPVWSVGAMADLGKLVGF